MRLDDVFDGDTIKLLRIPFSLFLLPVFIFGVSQSGTVDRMNVAVLFTILHLFIYPGSNAYNSYMDKDTGSIGGLKNPPMASRKLYYASIILDITGLMLALMIGWQMFVLILICILVSKAYSWSGIRLKKHGILSWLIVILFQGAYTFMMANMATEDNFSPAWFTLKSAGGMGIATLLISGFYPLTQIYQHEEDYARGDVTISYRLGIIGTFAFAAVMFISTTFLSVWYFTAYYTIKELIVFNACLLPATLYFLYWLGATIKNRAKADFTHTMVMTFVSSIGMIIGFSALFFMNR